MIFSVQASTFIILGVIIGVMAVIALFAFIIHRYSHPKLKEEKPNQEQILNEEMNRILKPIDDEDLAKEISEYKDEED